MADKDALRAKRVAEIQAMLTAGEYDHLPVNVATDDIAELLGYLASPPPAARAGAPKIATDEMVSAGIRASNCLDDTEAMRDLVRSIINGALDAAPEAPLPGQSVEVQLRDALELAWSRLDPFDLPPGVADTIDAALKGRPTPSPAGQGEAMPSVTVPAPLTDEYLGQMQAHVDEGGQLTHRNAVDLLKALQSLITISRQMSAESHQAIAKLRYEVTILRASAQPTPPLGKDALCDSCGKVIKPDWMICPYCKCDTASFDAPEQPTPPAEVTAMEDDWRIVSECSMAYIEAYHGGKPIKDFASDSRMEAGIKAVIRHITRRSDEASNG